MRVVDEIVRLDKNRHNIKSFDCGCSSVTQYLRRYANKNMALRLSSTFVLCYELPAINQSQKHNIAGYYTLANLSVTSEIVPSEKKLPRYPVPVILLAQLGIDINMQGRGLGARLLIKSLRHAYDITDSKQGIPAMGLVLDAVDDNALSFYQSFDFFLPFGDNPMRLFVPMDALSGL